MEQCDSSISVADARPDHQHSRSLNQEHVVEELRSHKRSPARSIAIVVTCTAALIVNTSNASSVLISLPQIGKAIDIQEDQLQWLITAYSLSSGCLLLLFGRLADLYGRKKGFLLGISWQMVFALGLGFSKNAITLYILRGFQGMGAAAAIPSALGILAHSFPPSRARSIAFATFASGAPIGSALGNIIGAVLTQLSEEHWRAPFFLSAGLSALCVLGGLTSFDRDSVSAEADARVDWIGAFLVTSGLVFIMFVLGQGLVACWETPCMIVCLVVGVILVGMFVVWEHHLEKSVTGPDESKSFRTPPPLMKLSIWTRAKGRMTVVLAIAFLNSSGFTSWTFWVQLYYQDYLRLTPVLSMVRFIPVFVMGPLSNILTAMLISKLRLVKFLGLGILATGFACVLFALIDPSATYWAFGFPATILAVVGADFAYAAGSIFVAKMVFPHEQSLAGGLFQAMAQLGSAFGLAISTIVFNSVVDTQSAKLGTAVNSAGTSVPMLAALQGYRAVQWTNAAFPFFASILAEIFLCRLGTLRLGHREQDPAEETVSEQQTDPQP